MPSKTTRRAQVRRKAIDRGVTWAPTVEMAQREIRRVRRRNYRRHRSNVRIFLVIFSLLVGAATFYFGFDLVTLRGAGMEPTLSGGYRVLCIKQSLLNRLAGIIPEDWRGIDRKDLVLIRCRLESEAAEEDEEEETQTALMIRRVTGIGGDDIDSGGGQLILNQSELVGDVGNGDLVYPVKVPAGRLFVTGDQSAVAIDSRMRLFGMVAESDVVGRPLLVVWPLYAFGPVT